MLYLYSKRLSPNFKRSLTNSDQMTLQLRQLEAFHSVIVTGSMTQAAETLSVSQPAISRLVAALEEHIGFPLFKRLAGRLRPTPEARYLFDEVEKILAHLKHISQLTEDLQDLKKGHFRIACLPGFATSLLPRLLSRFMQERPGLSLTLEPRTPERIHDWISARQFDIGISASFEENPAIDSETLLIRTVCVLPADHKLVDKKVITPTDLDNVPLIQQNSDHIIVRTLQKQFLEVGAQLKTIVEVRQFAPACIMAMEGLGVSIVSEIDAREYESQGLIIKPYEPSIPFQLYILYPSYMPRSIATLEFIEVFKQSLEPFYL